MALGLATSAAVKERTLSPNVDVVFTIESAAVYG